MTAGSSRGCLGLGASVDSGRLITGDEDSPTGPAARQALRMRGARCAAISFLRAWLPDRWSWLNDPGDRPDEADHLTRDCRGHDHLGLARCGQAAVALAQAHLRPPGDVADRLRQRFDPIEQLAADPGLHAVGPGAFDQDPAGMGVAGLGDAAAADAVAARAL